MLFNHLWEYNKNNTIMLLMLLSNVVKLFCTVTLWLSMVLPQSHYRTTISGFFLWPFHQHLFHLFFWGGFKLFFSQDFWKHQHVSTNKITCNPKWYLIQVRNFWIPYYSWGVGLCAKESWLVEHTCNIPHLNTPAMFRPVHSFPSFVMFINGCKNSENCIFFHHCIKT